tara:strand:+ start:5953 stop:6426 length:474 start_codon:yes stop_codon:yes gene_type:complete
MTTMTTIDIYIPRILGSVTKPEILSVFQHMDIGDVTTIDMKHRVNEKKNEYYYAFITIQLYSTDRATNFKKNVCEYGMIRLLYDEEAAQYWEIKHHIDRNKRANLPTLKNVPFFRYSTLSNTHNKENISQKEETYKPYNMWDTSFDILSKPIGDLWC